ncbi:MAG: hypothetical protein IKJ55_07185 [Clostridia bacterium]|nr:hypothetical protein [Clostridia bacterium]
MKNILTLVLLFIFLVSGLSVSAQTVMPSVATLSVSERDAEGFVTLSLELKGVEFQGVQASVFYNPEELLFTEAVLQNIIVGETADGKPALTTVQNELHAESNCLAFTAIMNLSLMDDEIYALSSLEKPIKIFTLKVPATTDTPDVGFALKESPVYDKGNPDGLIVSLNGESQAVDTVVLYADGTKGQTGQIRIPEKAKTVEELRAQRILNTVILQVDNYAAVQNGALVFADENNKAVMPFVQDDKTYVPYRFLAEFFGHTVGWDDKQQVPYLNGVPLEEHFVVVNERTFITSDYAETLLNIKATRIGNVLVFTETTNPWNADGVVEQGILSDAMFIMSPAIRDMK